MSDSSTLVEIASAHVIRPGVVLRWGNIGAAPSDDPSAVFVFSLPEDSGAMPGRMQLRHAPKLGELIAESESAFSVSVTLSTDALDELLAGDESSGAIRIRTVATGAGEPSFSLPLTPIARLAIESIRRCPFVGACRTMAFTARANDLLVEFLTALANEANPRLPPLTRGMTEQIHAAGETLKRELENPPALAALARRVGLSESTLKRGFHQVFGTTVFGYLRARRMEQARALLENGDATVLEAAAVVGYSNPSNFAAAFRRQFGINPKEFQLTARR